MSKIDTSEQVMPVYEMHKSSDFCLGKTIPQNIREPIRKVFYNINADGLANGNSVIVGMSGSFKTTLLKEMARDFKNKGLNAHEIDLQGDMRIPEEDLCIKIYANKRFDVVNYGINMFEFDRNVGGPKSNSRIIVNVIKKAFGTLGTVQSKVFSRLIRDFYKYHGIDEDDMRTWEQKAPTMKQFVGFYSVVIDAVEGEYNPFEEHRKKIDKLNYKKITMEQEGVYDDDDFEKVEKKLKELEEELSDLAHLYIQRSYNDIVNNKTKHDVEYLKGINLNYYKDKKNIATLKGLSYLIEELGSEIIFNGQPIEFYSDGLIRYDLSELTTEGKPTSAILFVEILLNHIFRFVKSRGPYANIKSKKKGRKYDTVIIMDESKLTLPTGSDKDNSFVLQHRIVSEGRKYGLAAIWASQLSQSFSKEILMNAATKIILKVEPIQRKALAKQFGIENCNLLEYTKITGAALVDVGDNIFQPIALPFANKNAFEAGNIKKRPF